MTPKRLNHRYLILQDLGKGGFGETFLAEDTHLPSKRRCVIKQLKLTFSSIQERDLICDRFQREAAILEQLSAKNNHIPQLYAYFSEAEQFYLVQEWIEGVTLEQAVKQSGVFPIAEVQTILLDLLSILHDVHSENIVHRDIKPSNIILRHPDRTPILIDFGVAKENLNPHASGLIPPSIAVGTKGYMPLEQAAGFPVYASDLYSLTLTAIYLLTGKSPHQLNFDFQTGKWDWTKDYPQLPTDLAVTLEKSLSPHPQDRYSSALAMRQALQQITLTHSPSVTYPQVISSNSEPTLPLQVSPQPSIPQPSHIYNTPTETRYRYILLNKVQNYWIKGVLESSLHGKAILQLGLEKRPDAVEHPWEITWESLHHPQQTLSETIPIIDIFDQLGAGRTLLILGEPGSGKTTTLLELARDLITRALNDSTYPIPVVFNLSSWKGETLSVWVVKELNTKYQVSEKIGQNWLDSEQLLLLLDGLDEVSSARRLDCLQAINQFLQNYGQTEVVVCCRVKDYQGLGTRLHCQGAVYIQPLTLERIDRYLSQGGDSLTAVRIALQSDPVLLELARSPLILSIITLAYQGVDISTLPHLDLEQRRYHLFETYIQRMFSRKLQKSAYTQAYSQGKAQIWLQFLAKRLTQDSQTVFLIERMQPNWLKPQKQKFFYFTGLILACIILGGTVGLVALPLERVIFWLILVSIIINTLFGVNRIQPVEALKWSGKAVIKNILLGLCIGGILGFILKIPYELIFKPDLWEEFAPYSNKQQQFSLLRGIVFGGTVGILIGLIRGLSIPTIGAIAIPNQGIRQSLKNCLMFGFLGLFLLGFAAQSLNWSFWFWANFGLAFGVVAGGGEASLKHFMLRLVLYCNGLIPWNYARFLDDATDRLFLQKVGGGYIFIHRLLLEHFARKSG